MASPTQWTWVWASSRNWWWTGRPGILQSMGSQRVGHDWMIEQNKRLGRSTKIKILISDHLICSPSFWSSHKPTVSSAVPSWDFSWIKTSTHCFHVQLQSASPFLPQVTPATPDPWSAPALTWTPAWAPWGSLPPCLPLHCTLPSRVWVGWSRFTSFFFLIWMLVFLFLFKFIWLGFQVLCYINTARVDILTLF